VVVVVLLDPEELSEPVLESEEPVEPESDVDVDADPFAEVAELTTALVEW
jgi:hypothetical protein